MNNGIPDTRVQSIEPGGEVQQEHYWSMEHYSYRDQPPAPQSSVATSPGQGRRATHGTRRRWVAACVLGATLVAGGGSLAVAQAADNPDQNPVQAAQFDLQGGHDHGDRSGPGRR